MEVIVNSNCKQFICNNLFIGRWAISDLSFLPLAANRYLFGKFQSALCNGKIFTGTALFFTKSLDMIPPYMVHSTIRGSIIYEDNILASIVTMDKPLAFKNYMFRTLQMVLSGLEIPSRIYGKRMYPKF